MFGKIKGKLGDIFKKNEEHLEDNADEVVEEEQTLEPIVEESKEEKKGFLGGLFSKKKESEDELNDLDEIKEHSEEELAEDVQDAVLEGTSEKEKEEIKSGKNLSQDEIKKHKEELEVAIKKEEVLEEETHEDIAESTDNEVEIALEHQEKKEELIDETVSEEVEEKKGFLGGLFSKKKKEEEKIEEPLEELPILEEVQKETSVEEDVSSDLEIKEESESFFSKALNVVKKKKITEDDYDKIWLDLEIFLLEINIAYEIVEKINSNLKETLINNSYDRFGLSETVRSVMVSSVEEILKEREGDFLDEVKTHKESGEPLKIMMLGVNGTGKTTSIGKIIKYLQNNNLSVVVAAADTFRAAAVDQIAKHCDNLGVKCIKHQDGGDPAAVAFDAVEHAKAKGIDVVLIDTAGRMPNNSNLMLELQKIKRVSKAQMALFIGDSISGNDLIDQITLFDQGVEINGVVLTKVDTDERPGSVVTCAYSINKPIYFLGVGQGYDDLVKFDAKIVAEKLFDIDE
jgi:fused signal recognition particle receptor